MLRKDLLIPIITGLWLIAGILKAGEIPFALELGMFQSDGNLSRLEVYLRIDQRQLSYEQESSRYANHLAGVVLLMRRGQIIDFRELAIDDFQNVSGSISDSIIIERAVFNLAPGAYDLQVVVEDQHGNRSDSTLQVSVPRYRGTELEMSTILLANMIRRSTGQSAFSRRGLTVRPKVETVYNDEQPLLWYYTEVYGLAPLDTFEIQATIWHDSTEVIIPITTLHTTSTMVFNEWGSINLSTLAEGDYSLALAVNLGGDTSSVMKPFTITRGALVIDDSSDVLGSFSEADLTNFAGDLSLLQPDLDVQRFNSADSVDRLRMIRDAAGKIELKFVEDSSDNLANLVRRWDYARTYGQDLSTRGQSTDQGQIILLYGLPDMIDAYPVIGVLRRHQIWTYTYGDSTGQVVFMDLEGGAELSVVHMTIPGGSTNEQWRTEPHRIPLIMDMTAVPAVSVDEEEEQVSPLETAPMESIMEDTPTVPGRIQGAAITNDSTVIQPAALEGTTIDTISGDSGLTESTTIDTTIAD